MTRKFLTPIILPADPANPLEAATKQYVDSKGGLAVGAVPATANWNTYTTPGMYSTTFPSGGSSNFPVYAYDFEGTLLVTKGSSVVLSQIWTGGDYIVVRSWNVATSGWRNWIEYANEVSANEVFVGPSDAISYLPGLELWVDTDEVTTTLSEDQRWNTAWGVIIPRTAASNVAVSDATQTTVLTLPGTFVAGRRYVVRMGSAGSWITVTGDNWEIGAALDGTVLAGQTYQHFTANYYIPPVQFDFPFQTTSGSHTVTVYVRRAAGTGTMQARWYASVEDVGPVSGAVSMSDPTPAWTQATYVNGWVTSGVPVSYRKIGDIVYLRGAASGAAASAGSTMLTLPVGYRPPANVNTPVVAAASTLSFIAIDTNGNVIPTSGANKDYISVSNVQFSVTP